MGRLRSLAFAIKDRLESEIPELADSVIVYRRKNIESEFQMRMAKSSGKAVIIRLLSAKNQNREKTTHRFAGSYTVTLVAHPALTATEAEALDVLMEDKIATALHGWWPDSIPSNGMFRCSASTITFPEDADYDVAVLTLDAPQTST